MLDTADPKLTVADSLAASNSRKVYITGSRADVRVPAREVALTSAPGTPDLSPVRLYDTSGPYTDADVTTDVRAACRRCDVPGSKSAATSRSTTAATSARRTTAYATTTPARTSKSSPACAAVRCARRPGATVTQLHYARKGIITPEMEFIALRGRLCARVRARRGGARPRDHPRPTSTIPRASR